jgi:hypothetical protein
MLTSEFHLIFAVVGNFAQKQRCHIVGFRPDMRRVLFSIVYLYIYIYTYSNEDASGGSIRVTS